MTKEITPHKGGRTIRKEIRCTPAEQAALKLAQLFAGKNETDTIHQAVELFVQERFEKCLHIVPWQPVQVDYTEIAKNKFETTITFDHDISAEVEQFAAQHANQRLLVMDCEMQLYITNPAKPHTKKGVLVHYKLNQQRLAEAVDNTFIPWHKIIKYRPFATEFVAEWQSRAGHK
jgi:hypothetical protein